MDLSMVSINSQLFSCSAHDHIVCSAGFHASRLAYASPRKLSQRRLSSDKAIIFVTVVKCCV